MKRILITGKNSYVGQSFIKWLEPFNKEYHIEELDLKNADWVKYDFSSYDSIFHVAGIAHVSTKQNLEELYYKVNRDLTFEVAKKAKSEGVSQFIFMSSMIVYGDSRPELSNITKETIPKPTNFYGKSKLQAEIKIKSLEDPCFKIVIMRPPMIYGKGSKGNFPKLVKIAKISPFFPKIENKRSMLHIDSLCELVRLIVKNNERGTFYPQNKEHINPSKLIKTIREVHNKKVCLTKKFNFLIIPFINKINILNKVFGNLAYDLSISEYKENYRMYNLKESIKKTEN